MRRSRKPLSVVRRIEGSNPSPSAIHEDFAPRGDASVVEDEAAFPVELGPRRRYYVPSGSDSLDRSVGGLLPNAASTGAEGPAPNILLCGTFETRFQW
jgi:hypothetical protein